MVNKIDFNLRPIKRNDLELILSWRNSEYIRRHMYSDNFISFEEHLNWFNGIQNKQDSKHLVFEYQGNPLGVMNVTQIDNINNKSYWGFYLGDPEKSRGYGMVMGYLGLNYIFGTLNIRKLSGEVFSFNKASIRFHKKLGFLEEGLFKSHILKNGVYEDVVVLAIFKQDWLSKVGEIEDRLFKG